MVHKRISFKDLKRISNIGGIAAGSGSNNNTPMKSRFSPNSGH